MIANPYQLNHAPFTAAVQALVCRQHRFIGASAYADTADMRPLPAALTLLLAVFRTPLGAQEPAAEISRDYRGITLGMSRPEVEELLRSDTRFSYRGEASLSLLDRPRAALIDAGGSLFIQRGLFQFEDGSLSAITLELNADTVDWYSVYTALEAKYGTPSDIDPQLARWDDGATRLTLERPLTVKYLDAAVFQSALEDQKQRSGWREQARENFLDDF